MFSHQLIASCIVEAWSCLEKRYHSHQTLHDPTIWYAW